MTAELPETDIAGEYMKLHPFICLIFDKNTSI